MIKLFRKIRLNLLSEGKTGKYLKYAIGEIALVVIGILIALAINDWNEKRKIEKQIISYMEDLIDDLRSDVNQYDINLDYYKKDIESNERLFFKDDYRQLDVDSISRLTNKYYLIEKTSLQTYEKIKNAGLTEALGSKETNKAVNDYYNLDIPFYKTVLLWDKEFSSKDFNFWLYNKNYEANSNRNYGANDLPFLTDAKTRKTDLIALIESVEGRNHLRQAITRNQHLIRRVGEFRHSALNLIEILTNELDN